MTSNINYILPGIILQNASLFLVSHLLLLHDLAHFRVEEPFEQFFGRIMSKIADLLERLPQTQVLVVPSGSRDVHHTFIYPTPPFEEAQKCKRIRMMTDPCIVNVEGISFGITSTDILFHLGKVISQTLHISHKKQIVNIIKHTTSDSTMHMCSNITIYVKTLGNQSSGYVY